MWPCRSRQFNEMQSANRSTASDSIQGQRHSAFWSCNLTVFLPLFLLKLSHCRRDVWPPDRPKSRRAEPAVAGAGPAGPGLQLSSPGHTEAMRLRLVSESAIGFESVSAAHWPVSAAAAPGPRCQPRPGGPSSSHVTAKTTRCHSDSADRGSA